MEKGRSDEETPGSRLEQWIEATYGGWGGKTKCARDLGMTPQQLSKYVQDKLGPQSDVRRRLAELGLNLHWYETGKGPMNAPNTDASKVGASGEVVGTITFETIEIDGRMVTVLKGLTPHEDPRSYGKETEE